MSIEEQARWCIKVVNEAMDKTPAEIAIVAGALQKILEHFYCDDLDITDGKRVLEKTKFYQEQCQKIDEISAKMSKLAFNPES